MKKCNVCGFSNNDESYFCESCGADIKDVSPVNNISIKREPIYANTNVPAISEEDNKKANILCTISLICYFGGLGFSSLFLTIFDKAAAGSIEEVIKSLSAFAGLIGHLAGIVLMIVARVKYPENKFSKVIMWLYIGLFIAGFILLIIGLILLILFIGMLIECAKGCQGLS